MLLGTIYSEQPPNYLSQEVQTAAARISIQVQLSYLSDRTFYILLLLFKYKEINQITIFINIEFTYYYKYEILRQQKKIHKNKGKKQKQKTDKYRIHTASRQQPIRIQFSHSVWRTVTANQESSLTLTLSTNEN